MLTATLVAFAIQTAPQENPWVMEEGSHEFELNTQLPLETFESLFKDQPGVELKDGQSWPLTLQNHHPLYPFADLSSQSAATTLRIPFKVPRAGRWSIRLESWTSDTAIAIRDPKKGYLAIDDDSWFALNPLIHEVKLRKGQEYELLILGLGLGIGKVELHAQRKAFDWADHARNILADSRSNVQLKKISSKKWEVVLENGVRQTPEEWTRTYLEEKSAPFRILALENLLQSSDPGAWEALIVYGRILSARGWAHSSLLFGPQPAWKNYWEEVRVAFLNGMTLCAESNGVEDPLFFNMCLQAGRPEYYLRAAGDYDGAVQVVQKSMRLVLDEHGELPEWAEFFPVELGAMLDWSGRKVQAIREFRKGIRLLESRNRTGLSTVTDDVGFNYTLTTFHLGKTLRDLGDEDGAIEAFELASKSMSNLLSAFREGGFNSLADWMEAENTTSVMAPDFSMADSGLEGVIVFWAEKWSGFREEAKETGVPAKLMAQGRLQVSQYYGWTAVHLASLYAQRGDSLRALKQLREGLATNILLGTLNERMSLLSASNDARVTGSSCGIILDGISVAEALHNKSMEISLLMRAYSLGQEMRERPEEPGWLEPHELYLRFFRVLMDEDTTTAHFKSATEQYRWTKPGIWPYITRQQRWAEVLRLSEYLVWDLNDRMSQRLIAFNHPKIQETIHWVKAACELSGTPYPESLEFKNPDEEQKPPALTLWSPTDGALPMGKRIFTVEGWLEDPSGLPDLRWRTDGGHWTTLSVLEKNSSSEGNQNKIRIAEEDGRWRFRFPLDVPAARGSVHLELQPISTSGLKGPGQSVTIEYQAGKRILYVLSFGVADYESNVLDLQWPVKDAEDISTTLNVDSKLYDEVQVSVLRNDEVSTSSLRRQMKSFLRKAGPDDTIIVFGAGHGVRDPDGEYYFLTSDATPEDPYAGVSRHDIEQLVTWSQLKAHRRILLLDTCQSGRGSADESSRGGQGYFTSGDIENALAATGGGVYILAGSTEAGSALEANGNGLFTAGVLAALKGGGDKNSDGMVSVEELREFVVGFVEGKTGGRQRPTFPLIEGGEDFPLIAN